MSGRERSRSRGRSPSSRRGTSPFRGDGGRFRSGSRGSPSSRSRGYTGEPYEVELPMPRSETHQLKVQHDGFPPGKDGTSVGLISNFYKLTLAEMVVFHYDVSIVKERRGNGLEGDLPAKPSVLPPKDQKTPSPTEAEDIAEHRERFIKRHAPQILERFVAIQPSIFADIHWVYDGYKNLYSVRSLAFPEESPHKSEFSSRFEMDIGGRPADFTIKLKLVDQVDLGEVQRFYDQHRPSLSERVVSIYETVLRFIMSKHYSIFQRKFFDLNTRTGSPRVTLADFVSGFISSVQMTEFGLALNLHLKTSCTVANNFVRLRDLVVSVCDIKMGVKPDHGQLFEANRFLRHLKFTTDHTNRINTYTIDSLIAVSPYEFKFRNKDGIETSIADFFQETYNIRVEKWPLVKTAGRNIRYLPLEICTLLPSQFLSANKVNPVIQRELLFKSTHAPNAYFGRLNSVVDQVSRFNLEIQRQFGIDISTKPTNLQGRVLPAPQVENGDNRSKFNKVNEPPEKWAVICFDNQVTNENLKNFVATMMTRASQLGLHLIRPCPVTKVEINDYSNIKNVFRNLCMKKNPDIVFVAIPKHHSVIPPACIYNAVKHYCDQEYGIISQCFKAEYIDRLPAGYFDNFLLKVNGKLGGINSILSQEMYESLPFDSARTILVGVDVNHPSETERIATSIGAAVGSLDPTFTTYTASIRVQKKQRDQIISSLGDMVAELLQEYQKKNRLLPENIIIFRNGVSDGQFDLVRRTEFIKVQEGINRLGKPMKIVFIVTQKMHHTRFALTEQNTAVRKPTWNVPSGTVVDNTIVNPTHKMFYLNSHFSPLGTSHPIKYVILRDDLNMSADAVQRLCFLLCHNNIRTRSVISLPTPIRYADLCAYRSKLHLEAQREILGNTAEVDQIKVQDLEAEIIAQLNDRVKISEGLKRVLFYC